MTLPRLSRGKWCRSDTLQVALQGSGLNQVKVLHFSSKKRRAREVFQVFKVPANE